MPLSPTRANTMRIVKQVIDKAFARHVAKRRRLVIDTTSFGVDFDGGKTVDELWSKIAAMPRPPKEFGQMPGYTGSLLSATLRWIYTSDTVLRSVQAEVLKDLHENCAQYELLSHMPPPRRKYERRTPKGLVERRAESVESKVQEWERKLKLAKTKLTAYRKKQKYYKKKGASV